MRVKLQWSSTVATAFIYWSKWVLCVLSSRLSCKLASVIHGGLCILCLFLSLFFSSSVSVAQMCKTILIFVFIPSSLQKHQSVCIISVFMFSQTLLRFSFDFILLCVGTVGCCSSSSIGNALLTLNFLLRIDSLVWVDFFEMHRERNVLSVLSSKRIYPFFRVAFNTKKWKQKQKLKQNIVPICNCIHAYVFNTISHWCSTWRTWI